MDGAKFRHRITIEEATVTTGVTGQPIPGWSEFTTISASVEPLSMREYFAQQTTVASVTHKINIRFYPGIKPTMRINFKDRFFEIVSIINPEERNVSLTLICVERVYDN